MFKKTYYSRHQVNQELQSDLHWVEQTQAEFEFSFFESDIEGVKEKIQQVTDGCKFELIISEPDKSVPGNKGILFIGRKKMESAA